MFFLYKPMQSEKAVFFLFEKESVRSCGLNIIYLSNKILSYKLFPLVLSFHPAGKPAEKRNKLQVVCKEPQDGQSIPNQSPKT